MLRDTIDFLVGYYFDDLPPKFATSEVKVDMARTMLTTHGAGGKFAEAILLEKFGLDEFNGIHDFDGVTKSGRPVEMKMETVNDSKKLSAAGSWSEKREGTAVSKKDLFLEKRPYLMNFGTCRDTGKCIYVLCTDTRKLPENADLFDKLDAKSPRTSFTHVSDHKGSYKLLYLNRDLFNKNREHVSNKFAAELERMDNLDSDLDELMNNA